MVFLFGCEFFDAGGLVRSGRQALLKKDFAKALELFVQAAQTNPKYRFGISARAFDLCRPNPIRDWHCRYGAPVT
jgi:hypothetical protein